jgi:hypothetical protein
VLLDNGNVVAFGDNALGQLGNGSTDNASTPTPVLTKPAFATQPVSQRVAPGARVEFAATIVPSPVGGAVTFQWEHFGSPIAGATAATLVLANVTEADAGAYRVIARNDAGETASAPVALVVADPVLEAAGGGFALFISASKIATPTRGIAAVFDTLREVKTPEREIAAGASVLFWSVGIPAGFGTDATRQWFRNGVELAGETSEFLLADNIRANDSYEVLITSADGEQSVRRAAAVLDVIEPVRITQQPVAQATLTGSSGGSSRGGSDGGTSATLQIAATGNGQVFFQWLRWNPTAATWQPIDGAIFPTLIVREPGRYKAQLTDRSTAITLSEEAVVSAPEVSTPESE